MQGGGVSIRYARALLGIGEESKTTARLQKELTGFSELYEASADLQNVLLNPSIQLSERKTLVGTLAGRLAYSPVMKNFLLLLLDKDRIGALPSISASFQHLADIKAGNLRAEVVTAHKLTPTQMKRMTEVLSKVTGKTVLLESTLDPDLIGGAVTRIGGKIYDGSLATQLRSLSAAAMKG